jgi:hypothetical protein
MADAATPKTADELAKSTRNCANWCYWIAGLTAVNAAMVASGSDTSFLIGTIVAQVAMFMAKEGGNTAMQIVALVFNVFVIGFFVLMGVFARKGHRWAFVVAFLAYAADTLVLFIDPSAIALGFHAWALFSLFVGFNQAKAWRLARECAAMAAQMAPPPLVGASVGAGAEGSPAAAGQG